MVFSLIVLLDFCVASFFFKLLLACLLLGLNLIEHDMVSGEDIPASMEVKI